MQIDALVAKTQMVGVQTSFETLMHIDELKALHAIAHSKLRESVHARAELDEAWSDLAAAFEKPMP